MYKYIYSKHSKTLHDSNCKYANRIVEKHMKSSNSWFFFRNNSMNFCKCCGYQAVIKENVDIAEEEIDSCARLPKDKGVKLKTLIKFISALETVERYRLREHVHMDEPQAIITFKMPTMAPA